jgi:pyruvate/2-oxoglutarate dehydrogenase complex dihydrolipoamide acyltransferase (E2) component
MALHALTLPDLGLSTQPVSTSVWLVDEGSEVAEGDRVLEVVCGVVAVDLSAPASGVLVEQRVGEDEPIAVGQVLGVIDDGE